MSAYPLIQIVKAGICLAIMYKFTTSKKTIFLGEYISMLQWTLFLTYLPLS